MTVSSSAPSPREMKTPTSPSNTVSSADSELPPPSQPLTRPNLITFAHEHKPASPLLPKKKLRALEAAAAAQEQLQPLTAANTVLKAADPSLCYNVRTSL